MKTLTVQVPDPVFEWLAATARQRQRTEAEVASETLASAAQVPTLGELMADLKGIGTGRYTDLSTNKKHLDDFGR